MWTACVGLHELRRIVSVLLRRVAVKSRARGTTTYESSKGGRLGSADRSGNFIWIVDVICTHEFAQRTVPVDFPFNPRIIGVIWHIVTVVGANVQVQVFIVIS